jgi:Ca-activated chloride channel family protein
MSRFSLALGIMVLASFGLMASDQKPNQLNKKYGVAKSPVDKAEIEKPAPVQQQETNQGAGKKGEVDRLPLDNLKAEKYTTKDGREGWKISIPGSRPLATPAVVDGMVYVGGGFGSYEFYAFNAETGKPAWAIRVNDDGPTAAVVARGVVAFNTESCTLFVVDAKTGRQLWSKWLGDPLMSQPAISEDKIFMAFPGSRGHQLIALGLKNGEEAWRAHIEGDIISAPVVYKDSVYLSTFDGTVYRFRMADGEKIWEKDFQATSAPWLYQDQVFVSKRENDASAKPMEGIARMEKNKGSQNQKKGMWNKRSAPYLDASVQEKSGYYAAQKANDSSVGFGSAPASAKTAQAEANVGQGTVEGLWEFQGSRPCVINGKLFLTQGDQVVALDPDSGDELWTKDIAGDLKRIGGHLAAPPSPAGKKLYVATSTGDIVVLSQKNGNTEDVIKIGSTMRFQPALAKGMLFVGTSDGQLIGIDLEDKSADGWSMWGGGPTHNGA